MKISYYDTVTNRMPGQYKHQCKLGHNVTPVSLWHLTTLICPKKDYLLLLNENSLSPKKPPRVLHSTPGLCRCEIPLPPKDCSGAAWAAPQLQFGILETETKKNRIKSRCSRTSMDKLSKVTLFLLLLTRIEKGSKEKRKGPTVTGRPNKFRN